MNALPPRSVDEILWSVPAVATKAENEWAHGFVLSILRQSKRLGWRPSPKQEALMRCLVAELYREADEIELFRGGD